MKTLLFLLILTLFACTKIEYIDHPSKSLDSLIIASAHNLPNAKPKNPIKIDTIIRRDTVFIVRQTIKHDTVFVNKKDTIFIINQTIVRDTIFVAALAATLTDIDWNIYHTVVLGTQTWMQENLKTTRFNDGTHMIVPADTNHSVIPIIWTSPYYYIGGAYAGIFGAYYNQLAVKTGKLCPVGWHIPSIKEWTILTDYLGGGSVAGSKMIKNLADRESTIESGFSGIMSGSLWWLSDFGGQWDEMPDWNEDGRWWSSDDETNTSLFLFNLNRDGTFSIMSGGTPDEGLTVRCLKN